MSAGYSNDNNNDGNNHNEDVDIIRGMRTEG